MVTKGLRGIGRGPRLRAVQELRGYIYAIVSSKGVCYGVL